MRRQSLRTSSSGRTEKRVDDIVILEVDDDSCWDKPIHVNPPALTKERIALEEDSRRLSER